MEASQWIIFTCVLLGTIFLALAGSTDPPLEENSLQLNLFLEAINELERQRVQENAAGWSHKPNSVKQRPNSKKMNWNRKRSGFPGSKGLESRSFAAYSSSISDPPNPDYINVKDYEPTPSPWWFNIN
ncbi:uncharacterized protein LOC110185533 [Drosophila serrata]|uniref:uncharacterized protein LOC110185533 n=1 Tax=Drosophila serrata TaxID=7274 RepID=UPI000A1D176E|nr:uncharacterized protein LOC110185533 [Drosophila serrata]